MGQHCPTGQIAHAGEVLLVGGLKDFIQRGGPVVDSVPNTPLARQSVIERRARSPAASRYADLAREQHVGLSGGGADRSDAREARLALGCADDDGTRQRRRGHRRHRSIRGDVDEFRRVPRCIDDSHWAGTGRNRRPAAEQSIRGNAGRGFERARPTAARPDRRACLSGVVCNSTSVVRVVVRECNVSEGTVAEKRIERIPGVRRVHKKSGLIAANVCCRAAGRCPCRDGHVGSVPVHADGSDREEINLFACVGETVPRIDQPGSSSRFRAYGPFGPTSCSRLSRLASGATPV